MGLNFAVNKVQALVYLQMRHCVLDENGNLKDEANTFSFTKKALLK